MATTVLVGCGSAGKADPDGVDRAAADLPRAGPAGSPVSGSGVLPPTKLGTYGAKLTERQLPGAPSGLRLTVPAIDIDAPVTAVGVRADGQLDVPARAGAVSWYRHGSAPGEPGSAVLAGHVDLGGERGAFWRIDELQVGERLTISTSAGSQMFEVVRTGQYAKSQLPLDEIFRHDGPPRVVLITCGGTFNPGARAYRDNVVVTAVLLPRVR